MFENAAGLHACIVLAGFNNDGDIDLIASGETNRKFFTADKSSIFIYNNGDFAEHANNKTLMQYK